MSRLVIVCLLGDPSLPAVSVKNTGGFQVDIQELLSNLKNSPFEIHVITNTSPYRTNEFEVCNHYYIHRIKFEKEWLDNQNLLMDYYDTIREDFFKIINSLLDKKIVLHSFYWLSGILTFDVSLKFDLKYVHSVVSLSLEKTMSGNKPKYLNQDILERKFLSKAEIIISISNSEKKILCDKYKIEEQKIEVVGRGVDYAFLHPCRLYEGYPETIPQNTYEMTNIELIKHKWWSQGAFTFIGRLQKTKGLHYILIAWLNLFKKYGNRLYPLWICGGTPKEIKDFRSAMINLVDMDLLSECEEQQKIVWWGYLDSAGLSTILLKTRALVMHSQFEAGGRVIIEALASAIPVIATPCGFAKDAINDEQNGLLVQYGDIKGLEDAMDYFMGNTSNIINLKNNARATYMQLSEKWNCYGRHFYIYEKLGLDSNKFNP